MSPSTPPRNTSRSHTALFVLLDKIRGIHSAEPGGTAGRIVYSVDRPGQNAAECYTIAALAFLLTTGPFTVIISRFLGGGFWAFVIAFPLASLFAFVAFHILFFGFAFLFRTMHRLALVPACAPRKLPETVYLHFFTVIALAVLVTKNPWFIASAIPWLAWFFLNLLAAIILFANKKDRSPLGNNE